jgi:molecular chaperone DnaK
MSQLTAVGIDLGTTFSAIGIVSNQGDAEIVPNAENDRLTPSAVFFDEDAIIVGQTAKDNAALYPEQVVQFVKRQMGGDAWHVTHDGQRYSAVDVSSFILAKLKHDAEKFLNQALRDAVITVPAYFMDEQRRATIAAGEQAGFRVLDLINEPTAAAIAFGVDRAEAPETVLVYDLGGGTFDVTIMRVSGKDIRIIATAGDHQLGGKDFDDAIMRHAVEQFRLEHSLDPTTDPLVAGDLRQQAEKAKRELSKRAKALIMLRAAGQMSRIEITRERFEELIAPKLRTSAIVVREALREAKLGADGIDRVLLIGGSTRVPAVAAMLEEMFGRPPDASVHADEAVTLGAALMAAHKVVDAGPGVAPPPVVAKVGGLQITDVTSHSFGIEAINPATNQRINSILIPRNSPIPAEVAKEFVTPVSGMTAIKVTIYQGEFQDPALCNPVGEFTLSGLPPDRPAGCKVRVTVSCAGNGTVSVSAMDIATGRETVTEVSYKTGPAVGKAAGGLRDRFKAGKPVL